MYTVLHAHVGMDLSSLLYADKQAEQHLLDVTTERSAYKAALDNAKYLIVSHFSSDG